LLEGEIASHDRDQLLLRANEVRGGRVPPRTVMSMHSALFMRQRELLLG